MKTYKQIILTCLGILLTSTVSFAGVLQNSLETITGTYVLVGQHENSDSLYNKTVRIRENQSGKTILDFHVSCYSKSNEQQYMLKEELISNYMYEFEFQTEGFGLCYTGNKFSNAILRLFESDIEIQFNPTVRTPGFDGVYRLKKVSNDPYFHY